MAKVFKILASIVAWILFLWGCMDLVYFFVTVGKGAPMIEAEIIGIASLFLSVCVMKLRQMLE